jgi:hypothetical protein
MFGYLPIDKDKLSDNVVTMNTITRRQLSRQPASLNNIKPGESVFVPDKNGGLLVTRRKKSRLSPEQMMEQIDSIPGNWPKVDALALMKDEE